jgi:hypothetical protein
METNCVLKLLSIGATMVLKSRQHSTKLLLPHAGHSQASITHNVGSCWVDLPYKSSTPPLVSTKDGKTNSDAITIVDYRQATIHKRNTPTSKFLFLTLLQDYEGRKRCQVRGSWSARGDLVNFLTDCLVVDTSTLRMPPSTTWTNLPNLVIPLLLV